MSLGSFKNVNNNMFINHIYLIYMCIQDLSLNNLQWLICHRIQPNQTKQEEPNVIAVKTKSSFQF